MDTESIGHNLSGGQFGIAYFNDHHQDLRTTRYWGSLDVSPETVKPTGKRTMLSPDEMVIPNQTHVFTEKVQHYIDNPSRKPIQVHQDPETGIKRIIDGHHRFAAARAAGRAVPSEYVQVRNEP